MQYALKGLNASGKLNSPVPLRMSVGLHDGPIVLGVVGDADRWDASPSQMQSTPPRASKPSPACWAEKFSSAVPVSTGLRTRRDSTPGASVSTPSAAERGSSNLIEILDALDEEGLRLRAETKPHFMSGLKARSDGDLYGAISAFSSVLSTFPSDKASSSFSPKPRES